jgi:cytochrome c-type biogenesis protein CcmE
MEATEIRAKYTYLIAIVLVLVSGVLAYDAFTSYMDPYLTVSEVEADGDSYLDSDVQVMGTVANGSLAYDKGRMVFDLVEGESVVRVDYAGSPPQNFQEGGQVVVSGKLVSADTLEATSMLVKCPSKYEGEGESLLADPIFLVTILVGSGAVVGTVVSTAWRKDA